MRRARASLLLQERDRSDDAVALAAGAPVKKIRSLRSTVAVFGPTSIPHRPSSTIGTSFSSTRRPFQSPDCGS
jgi:hypothetical protein